MKAKLNKNILAVVMLLLLITACATTSTHKQIATCATQYYAKIESDNVFFYSQAIDTSLYQLFLLPKTYFVLLTGNANDDKDIFYIASYMDKTGFVKKSEVAPVLGNPVKPFANNLSFSVFSSSGLELRDSPATTPFNIITTIPYLEKNLIYYGSISGDEVVPQMGTKWYYCKYLSNNSAYFGYLYSPYCYLLPTILPNTETLEYATGTLFENNTKPTETKPQPQASLSNELKIVIIICACLPCLFIIYLLFKPTKIMLDNGAQKPKKKYNRLRKSEYYEYDE